LSVASRIVFKFLSQLRYEKITNDPTKLAAQQEKSRQKYLPRREKVCGAPECVRAPHRSLDATPCRNFGTLPFRDRDVDRLIEYVDLFF
jgi:hypothetical protein